MLSSDYNHIRMGFSNQTLLLVSMSGFTVIFIIIGFLLTKSHRRGNNDLDGPPAAQLPSVGKEEEYNEALLNADVSTLNRAQRRARAKLQMKKYRRAVPRAPAVIDQEPINVGDEDEEPNGMIERQHPEVDEIDRDLDEHDVHGEQYLDNSATMTRKERQLVAKRREKEERKLYEQARRERSRIMDETLMREKLEKEKAALEAQEKIAKERKEKDVMEQERKKMMFVHHQNDSKQFIMTVDNFVHILQEQKQISLREMSNIMGRSKDELIQRIRELEDENRIPTYGIFDVHMDYYTLVGDHEMRAIIRRLEETGPLTLSSFTEECGHILSQQYNYD